VDVAGIRVCVLARRVNSTYNVSVCAHAQCGAPSPIQNNICLVYSCAAMIASNTTKFCTCTIHLRFPLSTDVSLKTPASQIGRFAIQNAMKQAPGPTAYGTRRANS